MEVRVSGRCVPQVDLLVVGDACIGVRCDHLGVSWQRRRNELFLLGEVAITLIEALLLLANELLFEAQLVVQKPVNRALLFTVELLVDFGDVVALSPVRCLHLALLNLLP